tara:strand:- start:5282 stop:7090 length:1809 start_codon:yes stop_codon:yes gene_type:complete
MTEKNNKRGSSDTNFAGVTFDEIKNRLVNRAKIYYPEAYKDFSKTSFGSLMMDMMALVGEQLSFYTQFVANENYISTTRTQEAYSAAAAKEGIQISNKYTSVGMVKVYIRIPAAPSMLGPDTNYQLTLLRGAVFSSATGATFTTLEDVIIDFDPKKIIGTEFTGDASRNTYYVTEIEVPVESGEERQLSVDVGTYRRFLKLEVKDETVTSIVSVTDSNGNEFFEVPNLSQDVIYREVLNRKSNDPTAPARLVPTPAPRRFEVRHEGDRTFLVFGFGSESTLKAKEVANPSDLSLKRTGRKYVSDIAFDPSRLLASNKFGVSPQNTTLTIVYRSNTSENSNAASNTIDRVLSAELLFNDESNLDRDKINFIRSSISCNNEDPINGSLTFNSTQEIAETIRSAKGARGRAVTLQDYVSLCYTMPSKFGSVYRASVMKDENDLKRNLNLFIISQDENGLLESPSAVLKSNLKKWLNAGRMISDTLDIFPAKIINLGIFFDVVLTTQSNKVTALSEIRRFLFSEMKLSYPQIGEYFSIGEVEKILSSMQIISRVNSVKVVSKDGTDYSDIRYDVKSNTSHDGSLIFIPDDFIWEVKFEEDITGKIL